jgi:CheY-like chemotaxis protein
MERQLLIADGHGYLSDIYQNYFVAHGYSVRVVSEGVECLKALHKTRPDLLVLDTELKWGGPDGVLAIMGEEDDLSTIPVVLLSDLEEMAADNAVPLALPSMPAHETPLLMRTGESIPFLWPSVSKCDPTILKWRDQNSIPVSGSSPNKRPRAAQVVDRLLKPFSFQNLLASISTVCAALEARMPDVSDAMLGFLAAVEIAQVG